MVRNYLFSNLNLASVKSDWCSGCISIFRPVRSEIHEIQRILVVIFCRLYSLNFASASQFQRAELLSDLGVEYYLQPIRPHRLEQPKAAPSANPPSPISQHPITAPNAVHETGNELEERRAFRCALAFGPSTHIEAPSRRSNSIRHTQVVRSAPEHFRKLFISRSTPHARSRQRGWTRKQFHNSDSASPEPLTKITLGINSILCPESNTAPAQPRGTSRSARLASSCHPALFSIVYPRKTQSQLPSNIEARVHFT